MKMTPIDTGFYEISDKDAKGLAEGKLPSHGHMKLVIHDDKDWWLMRTPKTDRDGNRSFVWSLHEDSKIVFRGGEPRFMNKRTLRNEKAAREEAIKQKRPSP